MNDDEFLHVVNQHREMDSHSISFSPSVGRLLDSQYCLSISKAIREAGGKWECSAATPFLGQSLPSERGLYMFVWRPNLSLDLDAGVAVYRPSWILYVGKAGVEGGTSDTIQHRYVSEYSKYVGASPACHWKGPATDDRHARLTRHLSLRPLEYWFALIENPETIQRLEKSLIRLLNPPVNRQHGARLRAGPTEPA